MELLSPVTGVTTLVSRSPSIHLSVISDPKGRRLKGIHILPIIPLLLALGLDLFIFAIRIGAPLISASA